MAEEVERHIVNGEGTSELFKNVFETEQRLVTPALGIICSFSCGKSAHWDGVNSKNAVLVGWQGPGSTFNQQATPSSLCGGLMLIQRR